MHDDNPIAYASASLTDCQSNYAQIEKELFAILFGCTRFHQYIYGLHIIVETDHKPLVTLFSKPLYKIPARLQRLMLRLLTFNVTVVYKPGKYLHIADALSRAPSNENTLVDLDRDLDLHCNFIMSQNSLTDINVKKIRDATKTDIIFQNILQYIRNGWPNKN